MSGIITNNTIKAKKVKYKGEIYDSQGEARWAVFFDLAKIDYLHHPKAPEGIYYSPDFWLTKYKIAVEIKGQREGVEKELKDQVAEFVSKTRHPLLVLWNQPPYGKSENIFWHPIWYWNIATGQIEGKMCSFFGIDNDIEELIIERKGAGQYLNLRYPEDILANCITDRELNEILDEEYKDDPFFNSLYLKKCCETAHYFNKWE